MSSMTLCEGWPAGFLIGIPVVLQIDSWSGSATKNEPLDSLALLAFSYLLTLAAVCWIGFRRGLRRGLAVFRGCRRALSLAVLALVAVFWVLEQLVMDKPLRLPWAGSPSPSRW